MTHYTASSLQKEPKDVAIPVEFLPWDSEFFGFRIAHISGTHLGPEEWDRVLAWCQDHRIRCLYYRADLSDFESLSAASRAGFLAIDVRVTLERSIDAAASAQGAFQDTEVLVRRAQSSDLPALEAIARGMGWVSRFALDAHFPRGASGEMYAIWVRKVSQSAKGVVYVGLLDDQIVGFIACSEDGRTGKIELVGVRRDLEGSGIATAILRRVIRWFAERGCETAQVVTQGRNVAAQCLYQRSGFSTQSVLLVYHRWFDEEERNLE